MSALNAVYLDEHAESPIILETPDDIDALIGRVRDESPPTAPILVDVHLSADPHNQGLDVGVGQGRGILRYAGRDWPAGVLSTNGGPKDGERPYFYMNNWTGFPANAEIPLDLISRAVKEFMATGGARPTCIEWQAHW